MQHAKKFKRITVKVKDTLIPIVVVLLLNVVLLLLMTIFHPRKYILVIQTFDQFGRPERTDMQCEWNNYQMMYVIPLLVLDLVVLCLAVYQAYRSRSLSTEFQEAKYILQALVCIFLVCIVGMPVQIM
jgi:protein-S-isoprenylcysteine O-methyltransferase Ste14